MLILTAYYLFYDLHMQMLKYIFMWKLLYYYSNPISCPPLLVQ